MNIVVTGSSGLIGSEAVVFFESQAHTVWGIDNNMRADFFGAQGDTSWNLRRLKSITRQFEHFDIDIRNREDILKFFSTHRIGAVIHCAAQPSHDLAVKRAFDDFDVNAVGTMNLLEATRRHAAESPFVFLSTNKVYGDAPNELPLSEGAMRWEYARAEDYHGIREDCRIDQSKHSLFGASKVAADVMVQEYGRYLGLPTVSFRGGCLTGPNHSGVEMHGFLSYLVKVALGGEKYKVYGYKGKQVRDQIHSYDVVRAMDEYLKAPRPGEVYNIGGGRENSASILECFALIEKVTGRAVDYEYTEKNREGDHICYISDTRKFRSHYPGWTLTRTLEDIVGEIVEAESEARLG